MSNPNRHPSGSSAGGRFAPGSRADADPSVQLDDTTDTDPESDVRRNADRAGWPLVADIAIDLNYQGELGSDAMQLIDDDLIVELGDEHIGPAIDTAEQLLERKWVADGAPELAPDDELAVPVRLDMDDLERRCDLADVPPYVAGFVESVADRDTVPPAYLNSLMPADLRELGTQLRDDLAGLVDRLRGVEQGARHGSAAA